MKLFGKKIEGPNLEMIVIPRGNGEDIVLKARAILDTAEFDRLCPEPKPPKVLKPGGKEEVDARDPSYAVALAEHAERRMAWIVITSLGGTEGLEWEKAKPESPDTWLLWREELKESGFGDYEIGRIVNGVLAANCLDEAKVEEARKRFTRSQAQVAGAQ